MARKEVNLAFLFPYLQYFRYEGDIITSLPGFGSWEFITGICSCFSSQPIHDASWTSWKGSGRWPAPPLTGNKREGDIIVLAIVIQLIPWNTRKLMYRPKLYWNPCTGTRTRSLTTYHLATIHPWPTDDRRTTTKPTVAQVQSAKNAHYHIRWWSVLSRITDPTPIMLSVTIVPCFLKVNYFVVQTLTTQQLTCLAIQLANAIRFLHQQQIVHGDIATRNCTCVFYLFIYFCIYTK